jgi:hypothetical protein
LGEEPEVNGQVQRGFLPRNLKGQTVEGGFKQRVVLGEGEGFDGDEGVEQGRAEAVGGLEEVCPAGAELFVADAGPDQERHGARRQAVLVVFEQAGQKIAVNFADVSGVGEEL